MDWRFQFRDCKEISIQYRVLCFEMTVRSNHVDGPSSFDAPSRGGYLNQALIRRWMKYMQVKLSVPRLDLFLLKFREKNGEYFADGRDELLDGIMEANPNRELSWIVNGCNHRDETVGMLEDSK